MTCRHLPAWGSVLAVVAHPDDESFGLGAILGSFAETGRVSVLCFSHGEASSLHGVGGDLRHVREVELRTAARALRVDTVTLLDYPDGQLAAVDTETLVADVLAAADRSGADGLVVFDPSGVTGHPDHRAVTAAALQAARVRDLPVLAWTLPEPVAAVLNAEFGAAFTGHPASAIDFEIEVDRTRQRSAVARHRSQAVAGSVLWRRLELLGNHEHLRWVHEPARQTVPMDWWYFLVERHLDRMLTIAGELGDDAVNAVPPLAGANSAYQIVFHCCGMLEWWTREVALGHPVGRDRDAEFVARGTVAELTDRVTTVKLQLRADLPSLAVDARLRGDPSEHYADTPIGRSVGGVLLHVLEELAQHHGHLDLTRDLLTG